MEKGHKAVEGGAHNLHQVHQPLGLHLVEVVDVVEPLQFVLGAQMVELVQQLCFVGFTGAPPVRMLLDTLLDAEVVRQVTLEVVAQLLGGACHLVGGLDVLLTVVV